jgi:class 3 adenylate cyclase
MADEYARLHQRIITPCLTGRIPIIGLTFGVDQGKLIRLKMNGRWEYIGRPLNVAARLMAALKAKDDRPQGKILMAKAAFRELGLSVHNAYQVVEVTRELKNVSGGKKYKAKRIWLYPPRRKRSAASAARLRQSSGAQ